MVRSRRGGEPVHIGRLIQDVITRRGLGGSLAIKAVREAYAAVASAELLERTHVAALRGGIVTIETDSSALAYELHGFAGKSLLAKIQQQPSTGFVKSLRFKVGADSHGR
jgi:hypothetical protein